ncbi:uncharacterized protein LOC116664744 [Camelus ferus]|uniref:Uncharacterized protein LOC116664744 n=1 Tax=Camelus ferus TaxID=419612 RepID=A0A8B8T9R7_CAMFR|nr:uncharacterized protein LOC116664744 [Camelus ferus]
MKKIQHSGLTLETEKDSERRQEKSAQQREAQSGLLGKQRAEAPGRGGWVQDPKGVVVLPCGGAQEPAEEKSIAQGPPARSAPHRHLAASQLSPRIWLAPSAGLRIWSQSSRGASGGESLRVTCGQAQPSVPSACRPRSLRPFPPARCPAGDSAGHRRARPEAARERPGEKHRQATRLQLLPAGSCTCTSVSRSVSPSHPRVQGPLRCGLAPPRGGNRSPPFLPPARRARPRGGRVSSRPSPAHNKVKLSRWRSFLALAARALLLRLGQFEVSTAGDKRDRVSPSWCPRGERPQRT